jgi:hypothetical protein
MNNLNIVRKMSNIISLIVGGTVDITAHEKLGEHKIAELCKAMGDDCGGTSVNTLLIKPIILSIVSWKRDFINSKSIQRRSLNKEIFPLYLDSESFVEKGFL